MIYITSVIRYLKGVVGDLAPGQLTLEVGGVGLEIACPESETAGLVVGAPALIHTYLHLKEDGAALYGFTNPVSRQVFIALISVNGVGPRTALALLGNLGAEAIVAAIARGEPQKIRAPGVGSRTAERIVLELTGKLPELGPANPAREEARLALLGLGYGARAVDQVLAELARQNPEAGTENLIRLALQSLH